MDVIYPCFGKALDGTPQDELLLKIWNYGIQGDLWLWLKFYLTHIRWYPWAIIALVLSVIFGVPSSIPGHCSCNDTPSSTFLICISLWWCHQMLKEYQFKGCCCSATGWLVSLSKWLLSKWLLSKWLLSKWSKDWQLKNNSKCYFMRFSNSTPLFETAYFLDVIHIQSKTSQWDLDMIFSSNLSWSLVHSQIISKAYKILCLISITFNHCNSVNAKKKC